jgi:hypothetical protein
MNRDEILKQAKEIFFKAQLAGYASSGQGVKKEKTPNGYTTITFVEEDWMVVDRYCVNPHSNYSAGTTTISNEDDPVWWMAYWGSYPKEAISFLRGVLGQAYRKGFFHGGRGLHRAHSSKRRPQFIYLNEIEGVSETEESSFEHFRGSEKIMEVTAIKYIGWHQYEGMSLI